MNEHRRFIINIYSSFEIRYFVFLNRLIGKSDGHNHSSGNHHTANGDSSTIAPPLPQIINETKGETTTGKNAIILEY
jgi:hypothetical protein